LNIFNLFTIEEKLQIADVGAAAINETPIYKKLFDLNLAYLYLFDGDERQINNIKNTYGVDNVKIFNTFLFDGQQHNLYICPPNSGMTSLFKPKKEALDFFNGFNKFGAFNSVEKIKTTKLDDLSEPDEIDFIKLDTQGAELEILKNGKKCLKNSLAIQLEVSFFNLYENQPTFGDIDTYLRSIGFVPHCFLDVKRWSITPTIFDGNYRKPGNQLLESDIIYIKDPITLISFSDIQLQKLAVLSHYCFKSIDLCVYLLIEMEKRSLIKNSAHKEYIKNLAIF
jgi:FkbM family methyltransferase